MTEQQQSVCADMYAALKNLPCRCQHNVPYEGCKVPRFVTQQCARCKSMEAHDAMVSEVQA
jgi:hypothetical protein